MQSVPLDLLSGGIVDDKPIATTRNGTEKMADMLKAGERYFLPRISLGFKFLFTTSIFPPPFFVFIISRNVKVINSFKTHKKPSPVAGEIALQFQVADEG